MSYYDHFTHQSPTAIGARIKQRARQRQVALLLPFLPNRDCRILEIGAGRGDLARLFLSQGYRNCTLVEPNAKLRQILAKEGFQTKDYMIPHLDEKDGSYDAILLFHVFEHLNGVVEAKLFMEEARRVLKYDGLLCILSPDYLHWQTDFFNGDYTHANITTVRRTQQLFLDNGFRPLPHTYFSGFISGTLATLVSNLVRLGLFFSTGSYLGSRLYKLKTTFLRAFLITGVKETQN